MRHEFNTFQQGFVCVYLAELCFGQKVIGTLAVYASLWLCEMMFLFLPKIFNKII